MEGLAIEIITNIVVVYTLLKGAIRIENGV